MAGFEVYVGDQRLERRELPPGPIAVGRSAEADWSFGELGLSDLSSRHLELARDEHGVVRVRDLGSTNGTRVNGVPIEVCELKDGDEVRAGSVRLVLRMDPALAPADALQWAIDQLDGLVAERTPTDRLRRVVALARAATGAGVGWALQWEGTPRAPRYRVLVHEGGPADVPEPSQVSTSIVGRATRAGRAVWTEDATADARFRDAASVRALALRTAAAIPLGGGGVLFLAGERPIAAPVRARVEALCRVAAPLVSARRPPAPDRDPSDEVLPGVVGRSPAMRELAEQVRTFAALGYRILLLGERGTGKSLIARAVHQLSGTPGALVHADCPNLVSTLAESLLFGHERGAFANATHQHVGWVGRANGGTLFLDEIGDLPAEIQPKLLSLLEEGTFEPVGATRRQPFTGRVVAATNRDLEAADSPFRRDLFDRLAQVVIRVPALRDRPGDVPLLARRLFDAEVERIRKLGPTPPSTLSPEALAVLAQAPLDGNVRALQSMVIRGIGRALVEPCDEVLPRHLDTRPPSGPATEAGYWEAVHGFERRVLEQALAAHDGNQTAARKSLGLSNGAWDRAKRRTGLQIS
ncbi:MAG: sigma 54-interacting transcriptional regulator [Myxococcota bacterium]